MNCLMLWLEADTGNLPRCVKPHLQPFLCCVLRLCGCGDQTFCQRVCGTGHAGVQLLQLCRHSEEI